VFDRVVEKTEKEMHGRARLVFEHGAILQNGKQFRLAASQIGAGYGLDDVPLFVEH
jgi:hypothetical protein